jgi:hypothetical protein
MTTPRATLIVIPNEHLTTDGGRNVPPDFDPTTDFVAYMPNRHGEQLVFVQKRAESTAALYHGDNGWEPVRVGPEGTMNPLSGILLDRAETLFVFACTHASELWRRP